jgi:uncharacterized protein YdhG (YjbR/CyaY superfamily)
MKIAARSPKEYLEAVPADRRPHLVTLRNLIRKTVPTAKEGIVWGMLGWTIHERPFVALASQKNYLSLYLMDLYTQPGLREKHAKALAPLNMGKSCINFDSADELPLDAIEEILKAAPGFEVKGGTMAAKTKKKRTAAKKKK